MTWDELFAEQFKEVDEFKAKKDKEFELLERDPNFSKEGVVEFKIQWKREREELYAKHKEQAEKYLDRREAEAKRLAQFKKMAKEYPENEYWTEAVERMEKDKKLQRDEEIRQYNDRNRGNSQKLER